MEQSPFPEFHVSRVGRAIDIALDGLSKVFRLLPSEAPPYMSEHYHGAERVLDAALVEPVVGLPILEKPDAAQLRFTRSEEWW